jgi:hypothetical protein
MTNIHIDDHMVAEGLRKILQDIPLVKYFKQDRELFAGMKFMREIIDDYDERQTLTKEQIKAQLPSPDDSLFDLPFQIERGEHKYSIGDIKILTGLKQFPFYNGTTVEIIGYREDGEYGLAYYVKGAINREMDWVYENRLTDGLEN